MAENPAQFGLMLTLPSLGGSSALLCCGIVLILLIILLIIIIFYKRKKDFEAYAEYGMGDANAPTTIIGYKHPCKYCDKLVNQGAKVCPFCGKVSPLGPFRCPKCMNPTTRDQVVCSACGLALKIICPFCKKETFFGDYCDKCDKRLLIVCPNCLKEQPPIGDKCMKCGKKIKKQTTPKVVK